jgi:hypothetical protein
MPVGEAGKELELELGNGEFGQKKVKLGLMGNSRFFQVGPFFQKSPAFKLPNYQLFTYLCSRN